MAETLPTRPASSLRQAIARIARLCERTGFVFLGAARRLRQRISQPGQAQLTVAIVIPLAGAAANWLQRTKFEWLSRYQTSPGLEAAPHITLKMGCKVTELEPIARYLAQLAAQTSAPRIALRNVGRFGADVMFLDVLASDALDTLRRRIVGDLQNRFGIIPEELEGDAFHSHATIGFGLPANAFNIEFERLQGQTIAFSEIATAMELWVHVGSNWACYYRAEFQAGIDAAAPTNSRAIAQS